MPFDPHLLGLHILTQELGTLAVGPYAWSQSGSKERIRVALQEMFPASIEEKVDKVHSVTESYHKYKREYVKHLSFNPEEDNLSKCFFN